MKYRKKLIVIEAWQFTLPPDWPPRPDWLVEGFRDGTVYYQGGNAPYLTIETLQGPVRADLGDWIIQGLGGELYPCKPAIFSLTYDPVE